MYNQNAVLLLIDDPDNRASIIGLVENNGLRALCPEGPSNALRVIDGISPVLAVIDLDGNWPDNEDHTVVDVLAALDHGHPTCTVLVFSDSVSGLAQQGKVWAAHKAAVLQEKQSGPDALLHRIRQLVSPVVGDLEVRDGAVRQRGGGAAFTHWVACALMIAYPRALLLATSRQVKAAQRFREWVVLHSDSVQVSARGSRLYALTATAPRTLPSSGPTSL